MTITKEFLDTIHGDWRICHGDETIVTHQGCDKSGELCSKIMNKTIVSIETKIETGTRSSRDGRYAVPYAEPYLQIIVE